MSMRIKLIQKLVHINESIFFYPKLKRFYQSYFGKESLNIIDIGANKGQSIDFFLTINPKAKIDSFEPNKKLFKLLQKKFKRNHDIQLHNIGVSNFKGELEFHENVMDETSTFEDLNFESQYLKRKAKMLGVAKENLTADIYKVDVIRLSDFLENQTSVFFDILKIDVEGHELQCLEGLFNQTLETIPVRLIQLESHNDDMYMKHNQQQSIETLLYHQNFHKVAEIKHGFGDFVEIIYENKRK